MKSHTTAILRLRAEKPTPPLFEAYFEAVAELYVTVTVL